VKEWFVLFIRASLVSSVQIVAGRKLPGPREDRPGRGISSMFQGPAATHKDTRLGTTAMVEDSGINKLRAQDAVGSLECHLKELGKAIC
jgi:hypothetical protein